MRNSSPWRESWENRVKQPLLTRGRSEFLDITLPMRKKFLGSIRETLKSGIVADPDMWECVQSAYAAAFTHFWSDLEHEFERTLEEAYFPAHRDDNVEGPTLESFLGRCWCRVRAFTLYHYLPFDKSFFGKLKDPIYIVFYIATLMPIYGLRVLFFGLLLLMLLVPGEANEYQLVNFILIFKGYQFMTSGVMLCTIGAMKYFYCASAYEDGWLLRRCIDDNGPGSLSVPGQLVDFLGSIILVWIAFMWLPHSNRIESKRVRRSRPDAQSEEYHPRKTLTLAIKGGRLGSLLRYDVQCFLASCTCLGLLLAVTCRDHEPGLRSIFGFGLDRQLAASIYWCRVLYSLLSFPFAGFMLPVFQKILTHCVVTGYNKAGACVMFELRAKKEEEEELVGNEHESAYFGYPRAMNVASAVLRMAWVGRGRQDGDFQMKDVARGIKATAREVATDMMTGAWERTQQRVRRPALEPCDEEEADTEEMATGGASVALPAEWTEWRQEGPGRPTIYFCVEVTAARSMDASHSSEPWRVMRTYEDFSKLAQSLGAHVWDFGEVGFPGRHALPMTGALLEERRKGLEMWLNWVLRDRAWSVISRPGPVHDFLYSDAVKVRPRAISSACFFETAGTFQMDELPLLARELRGYVHKYPKSGNGQWLHHKAQYRFLAIVPGSSSFAPDDAEDAQEAEWGSGSLAWYASLDSFQQGSLPKNTLALRQIVGVEYMPQHDDGRHIAIHYMDVTEGGRRSTMAILANCAERAMEWAGCFETFLKALPDTPSPVKPQASERSRHNSKCSSVMTPVPWRPKANFGCCGHGVDVDEVGIEDLRHSRHATDGYAKVDEDMPTLPVPREETPQSAKTSSTSTGRRPVPDTTPVKFRETTITSPGSVSEGGYLGGTSPCSIGATSGTDGWSPEQARQVRPSTGKVRFSPESS